MVLCLRCGFDSFLHDSCAKCGLNKITGEQLSLVWLDRLEPRDKRFWTVLEIKSTLNEFWLPILLERLSDIDLFGLGHEVQSRERWMYFCDDEDDQIELDLNYAELKARLKEFEQILASDPQEFRHIVQQIYWPKLLGYGAHQRLVLDKYVFRNRRVTENGFEGFWERQHQNFATLGFHNFFREMENSLSEVASSAAEPLSEDERQLIGYFHGAILSGDSHRARSWKNRWSK